MIDPRSGDEIDESIPLTPEQLAAANKKAAAGRGSWSAVIREPESNVYGPYKLLARTDGLHVLHDTRRTSKGDLGNGAVFRSERGARAWADRYMASATKS